jgi:hypothetical protein
MVGRFALVIAILTAALQSYAARAQTEPCMACRVMRPISDCDDVAMAHPPSGAVSVVGTVVEANGASACGTEIGLDLIRSSQAALSQRIIVDIGPCLLWRQGDTIRVMLDATPSPDGRYKLRACK